MFFTFVETFLKVENLFMTEKVRLEEDEMKNALAEERCPVCAKKIYPEGAIVISNGDSDVAFH